MSTLQLPPHPIPIEERSKSTVYTLGKQPRKEPRKTEETQQLNEESSSTSRARWNKIQSRLQRLGINMKTP